MIILEILAIPFAIIGAIIILCLKILGFILGTAAQLIIGAAILIGLFVSWLYKALCNIIGIPLLIVASIALWIWDKPITEKFRKSFKKAFAIKIR